MRSAYETYVTDILYYQGRNQTLQNRFYDMIHRHVETRSGDEIAAEVMEKAGLTFA